MAHNTLISEKQISMSLLTATPNQSVLSYRDLLTEADQHVSRIEEIKNEIASEVAPVPDAVPLSEQLKQQVEGA